MSADDHPLTWGEIKKMKAEMDASAWEIQLMLIKADEQIREMKECIKEMRGIHAEIEELTDEGEEWKR